MQRLFWVLGIAGALVAAALVAAAWLLDAEALREPLARAATSALEREVKLGAMRVALLPLPSVEVRDLSIAGAAPGDAPLARAEALRLRVALWPLLSGRVIVRALEIERAHVVVPLDASGAPVLPGPAAKRGKAAEPADAPREAASAAMPALAVQRVDVRDAQVQVGEWQAKGLSARGSLDLDGKIVLELRTDLAGPVQARGAALELGLRQSGGEVTALDAGLDVDELSHAAGGNELRGPVRGTLRLGGPWELVLSDASLRVPGAIEKRPGVALVLEGQLGPRLEARALGGIDVEVGRARLQLVPDPKGGRISARGKVAIADLEGVLDPALPLRGGTVELEGLGVQLDGMKLFGRAILDRLVVEGPRSPIEVSGTAVARGRRIWLEEASAQIGGERVGLGATYDLDSGSIEVRPSTEAAKLAPLLAAVADGLPLEGSLTSNAALELRGGPETLTGQGRLAIMPGQIHGFSLVRQVLGDLAAVPVLVAALRGKDLSRYEQEDFEELSADFRIGAGRLATENLLLRYSHAVARLRGSVGILDRTLDLSGELELSRDVESELGKTHGEPTRIPISQIGGTLDSPRVHLDRKALAQLALAYTGRGRVQEKLEEKLGREGAEAIEAILERLGGKQP